MKGVAWCLWGLCFTRWFGLMCICACIVCYLSVVYKYLDLCVMILCYLLGVVYVDCSVWIVGFV